MRPGVATEWGVAQLKAAHMGAGNIVGRSRDATETLRFYREWAAEQSRMLGPVLVPLAIERLITSQGHWFLQGVDPQRYGHGLSSLIQLEIDRAQADITAMINDIVARRDLWVAPTAQDQATATAHAVVLDTNVLLRHSSELGTVDWLGALFDGSPASLTLGIPGAVIAELDRLKQSRDDMVIDGKRYPRRSLARAALRMLDTTFDGGGIVAYLDVVESPTNGRESELRIALLFEEFDRVPLPTVDAEVIDSALEGTTHLQDVAIATYDRALTFRARALGLRAGPPRPESD